MADNSAHAEDYEALFDLLPVAVLVATDPACTEITINGAARRLLAVPPGANISLSVPEDRKPTTFRIVRDGQEARAEDLPLQRAAATGQEVIGAEYQIVRSDGSAVTVYGSAVPLFGADGQPRGSVGAFIDATPMKQMEASLKAQAAREALLNQIGQALRLAPDPEAVQETAARLLGEALGADRCYFAQYDLREGVVTIARDWRRADQASIGGVYAFPNTAEMFRELYQSGNTSVIADAYLSSLSAQTKKNMEFLGLRARISVALVDGEGLMATLTAAMADTPRAWTADETALVEAVGTQLRTAVEMTRIIQREHRIAQQLQTALQPPTPATVPGLALAAYYRPAWEDQGVGGDFTDAFAADKGVSFLVVGDLSGKGLAAASQVAMVRHMLRFALLNGRTVAGPISALNQTLAGHNLLTGFATLFVGRFDAGNKALTYVNCGQDAGLILRAATGAVEPLPPTGPILGAFDGAGFDEQVVALATGDVLALYTDGLTEAGPSRAALLTGDGVAEILAHLAGITDPHVIVQRLIAGVDTYAATGARDDQCLLAAHVM